MAQCETMSVIVPSKDVSSSGTLSVSVANASVVSNSATFAVMTATSGAGAPAIISFSPMAAPAGGVSFPLAIAALNVASGATVTFGAQTLTPTEPTPCVGASACVLQVQVPSSAIATSQAVPVSITNPGASGGTSAPPELPGNQYEPIPDRGLREQRKSPSGRQRCELQAPRCLRVGNSWCSIPWRRIWISRLRAAFRRFTSAGIALASFPIARHKLR